jgi:hypothetical protein
MTADPSCILFTLTFLAGLGNRVANRAFVYAIV